MLDDDVHADRVDGRAAGGRGGPVARLVVHRFGRAVPHVPEAVAACTRPTSCRRWSGTADGSAVGGRRVDAVDDHADRIRPLVSDFMSALDGGGDLVRGRPSGRRTGLGAARRWRPRSGPRCGWNRCAVAPGAYTMPNSMMPNRKTIRTGRMMAASMRAAPDSERRRARIGRAHRFTPLSRRSRPSRADRCCITHTVSANTFRDLSRKALPPLGRSTQAAGRSREDGARCRSTPNSSPSSTW